MIVVNETPWMPDAAWLAALSEDFRSVLMSPNGVGHLALHEGTGVWHQLLAGGTTVPLTGDMAIRLRPADVNQIIRTSMIWAITLTASTGPGISPAVLTLIDEVALGAKVMIARYATLAAARRAGPIQEVSPRDDVDSNDSAS